MRHPLIVKCAGSYERMPLPYTPEPAWTIKNELGMDMPNDEHPSRNVGRKGARA